MTPSVDKKDDVDPLTTARSAQTLNSGKELDLEAKKRLVLASHGIIDEVKVKLSKSKQFVFDPTMK